MSRVTLNKESSAYYYHPTYRKNKQENEVYYKIPLHLEYLGPAGRRIRPNVSYGVNLHAPVFTATTSLTVGTKVKLYKGLHFGVAGDFDFTSSDFFLIPSKMRDYSLLGGVYLDF